MVSCKFVFIDSIQEVETTSNIKVNKDENSQ